MKTHEQESYGKALKYLLIIPGAIVIDIVLSILFMIILPESITAIGILFLILATIVAFVYAIIRTIVVFVRVNKNNKLASHEYCEKMRQEKERSKLRGADADMLHDTDYNYSGMDLSNKDFSNIELYSDEYDFSYCNLKSACFRNDIINGAIFDGADLTGVSFEGATIRNATFRGSIIESVNFRGASLDNVIFENVTIRNCETREIRITNSQFIQIDAEGLLTGIMILIKDSVFLNSNLRNASLSNIKFSNVTFERTDLEETNLSGAVLSNCTFNDSKMDQAYFNEAKIIGGRFDRSKLQKARFVKCGLKDVEFKDCNMKNINADKAYFENIRTESSNLQGASLKKTGYEKADENFVRQHEKSNHLA